MPSSISLGVLELQSPNIFTYLMNVSCMDDMKKVYCPLYLVVNYAPTPTSPMHGETSHVQVKDPVCSVVTLMHGGSSCRFDSLYFYLKKCNIFVTKVSIYMYIHRWMMDDLRFYVLFNSISVISGRWADDNERLCAMGPRLRLRRFRLERGSNSGPLDQ